MKAVRRNANDIGGLRSVGSRGNFGNSSTRGKPWRARREAAARSVAKALQPYKGCRARSSRHGAGLMTAIRGAAAAVTGAASGIGRAPAPELAARGCDLALADRDEPGLQSGAAEAAKARPRTV